MVKTVVSGLFVAAALFLCQSASDQSAVAQAKKDTKKTTAGVIEIGEGKDGKFRFFVRDGEGKLLAMSGPTGFPAAADAEKAIESLKQVVGSAKVVTLKKKAPK